MSRLAECDDYFDDADIELFEKELRAEYRAKGMKAKLRSFLAYLDGMPRKVIIANRFYRPATGDMCSVAAFCASAGFDAEKIRKVEAESRLQRLLNEGVEEYDGWEGPTVGAGVQAGLPQYVAYDFAFHNEMRWDQIQDGWIEHPGEHYPEGHELHGTHWMRTPWKEARYRPLTDEERWLRLRNFIADKIGEPKIEAA